MLTPAMLARLCLVVAALLPLPLAAAHPMDNSFTWGNQTVALNSSIDPQYESIKSDLTLTESRYPFVVPAPSPSIEIRGDGFRNDVIYRAPANTRAQFVRLAEK